MSAFRTRLLGVLGSVISASACSPEAGLREGLEGKDLCAPRSDGSSTYQAFSYVEGLEPATPQDYLEWRSAYVYDAASVEGWESTKSFIVDDPSLTETERGEQLEDAFDDVAALVESTGTCDYASGCDRYVLPPDGAGFGRGYDGARYHLFAHGASGPTLVATTEQAEEFLGEIDTPHEAAWIATTHGYDVVCDGGTYTEDEDGYQLYVETGTTCGGDVTGHRIHVARDGALEELDSGVVEKGDTGCAIGRLPSGAVSLAYERTTAHVAGSYFADAARLEGASIVAFLELARDLRHHGAPPELVAWAERAAREETRHAEICRALAQRYGATVSATVIEQSPVKSLLELALDNAVEGLTREAFGALVAHHQMLTATDPAVRAAMRIIARDEASHAEFSIALHRWLVTQLDETEHQSVARARAAAPDRFRTSLCPALGESLTNTLGLPRAEVATELFDRLFALDWAETPDGRTGSSTVAPPPGPR